MPVAAIGNSSTLPARLRTQFAVRICVIFNPVARGEKARRFRRHLDQIGAQSSLKLTASAGDARRLAAEAVREGFETVVAAGGDGTVNEVLNGIGDVPGGFEQARLAVLPLGTVNVFARELALSRKLERAWNIIVAGRESRIDLPRAEFVGAAGRERRYFAQMAGAGLDARAVELVQWELKKKVGPLAYVWAGLQAMRAPPAKITVTATDSGPTVRAADATASASLVLVGNGKLYGGDFRVFSQADLRDGFLEMTVFPRTTLWTAALSGPSLLLRGCLPASVAQSHRAASFQLSSPDPVPLELDGELAGHLPATFSVERERLRVIVP